MYVGFYSRKHAKDVNGFVLGGRGVGPWLTAFAFGTSYFSAVIFVGYAGQFGWNFGLASTWAGLGNAFIGSLLAWNVLGRRTRVMTQHLDAKTMPDFFGKRFESVPLKVAASVIVFIFLIPYTASLYNGLSSLITSSVNVELDVSTSDDSVDMDADNTSKITTAITIDGSVDNIVGMIVSNNGFPVISLITTRSAYNRPKPPRK